jgi:hypothetical protein
LDAVVVVVDAGVVVSDVLVEVAVVSDVLVEVAVVDVEVVDVVPPTAPPPAPQAASRTIGTNAQRTRGHAIAMLLLAVGAP